MRNIFVLENMAACQRFMQDHFQRGYTEESFLGVGTFSTSPVESDKMGVDVFISPHFLKQDLVNYIIQGHVSIFEQSPILFQYQDSTSFNLISKWLITGFHNSIFTLPKESVEKQIEIQNLNTIEDFINHHLSLLIEKINEMRAQIVIVLLDFQIIKKYFESLIAWKKNHIKSFELSKSESNLDRLIIKETLLFFSNAFFNNKIAVVPSQQNLYPLFIDAMRDVKKELNSFGNDVVFRL